MNRKLHNTFSALSVAVALMTAGLIAATPAPGTDPVATRSQSTATVAAIAPVAKTSDQPAPQDARADRYRRSAELRAEAIERASLARAKNIEARAEALAKQLEGNKDVGDILGHVAGFTAQVATEAALNAAVDEFTSAEDAETYAEPPAPASKLRHSRRSLAMPYFSCATKG